MNAISNVLQNTCRAISFGSEIIGYTVSFGQSLVTPKAVLAARLLAAESQLAMCTQRIEGKKAPRPLPYLAACTIDTFESPRWNSPKSSTSQTGSLVSPTAPCLRRGRVRANMRERHDAKARKTQAICRDPKSFSKDHFSKLMRYVEAAIRARPTAQFAGLGAATAIEVD